MLQTVEAIYDPKQGLVFSEPVSVQNPVKVLVTFIESKPVFEKGSAQGLLAVLKANKLPQFAQASDADIEAQIQENV